MICPHCGKEFKDGLKFCTNCGMAATQQLQQILPVTPAPAPVQAPAENKTSDLAQSILNAVPSSPASQYLYDEKNKGKKKKEKKVKAEKTPKAPKAAGEKKPKGKIFKKVIAITLVISILGAGGYFGWKYIPGLFASKDEALEELVAVIDDAEEVMEKCDKDIDAVSSDVDYERDLMAADVYDKAASDLEGLKTKADKIKGLDQKSKDACTAYFEMTINSRKAMHNLFYFCAEYDHLQSNYFAYFPLANLDYYKDKSDEEFFQAYVDWYNTTKEQIDKYDQIPSCVASDWEKMKNDFSINESIITKSYYLVNKNDPLRSNATIHLIERFSTLMLKHKDGYIDSMLEEKQFAVDQRETASELADEIRSYAKMSESDRDDYTFKYTGESDISFDYDVVSEIYPSLYNTYDAFAIIKTGCKCTSKSIVVEAEIPGFTQKYKQSFDIEPSFRSIIIKPAALTGDIDLSVKKSAQLNISIYEKDGKTLIDSQSFPIEIKGKNDFVWYDDDFGTVTRDNILCYLTPNSEGIDQLKRNAITEMINMTNGSYDAMLGYQGDYLYTYLQAAGLMRALYDMGVRYNMDPYSFDSASQYIKLPDEVLSTKSGLCIETSLVIASALQSAGMNAYIVLTTDHAQVALETKDGSGEYYLIETTALSESNNNNDIYVEAANLFLNGRAPGDGYPIRYYNADQWAQYLSEKNCYIIDCNDAKTLGMTPFSN